MPPANDDYRKRLAERKRLLARESQKRQREKAFSTPAPARFGVETDTKQDRVTDFGKPFESSLLTTNQTAKTIDRFAGQMLRRYTVNVPKGAYAVGRDTLSGGESAFKPAPAWMRLLYGPSASTDMLYNMATNEKFNDAIAPADFFGASGILRGIGRAATSMAGKATLGTIGAGLGFGAANTETAEAAPAARSAVRGLTADSRLMREAFEFTRDIAERAQREGQEALTPAERVIKRFQTRSVVRPSQEQLESLREILPNVSINPSSLNMLWKTDFLNAAQEAGEELPVFLSRGTRGVKLIAEDSPFDLNLVRHFLEAGKLGLRTPIEDIPKYDIGGMRIYRFNDPDMIKRANAVMRGEARGANKLYELLTDMPGRVGSPYQFSVGEAGNLRNALDETIGLPAPTVSAIWSSAGKLYPYVSKEPAGTIGALEKMRSKTRPIIESAVEDRLGISDQGKAARQTILNFINSAENQTNVSQAFNALKSDIPFASLSGMSIPKDTPRTTVDLLRGILKKGSPLREVYEANTDLFNTTTEEAREILQKESPLNLLPNRTSDALIKSTKKIRNMAKRGVPEEDINAALREITDYIVMVGRLPKQKQPATSDITKFLADIENRL